MLTSLNACSLAFNWPFKYALNFIVKVYFNKNWLLVISSRHLHIMNRVTNNYRKHTDLRVYLRNNGYNNINCITFVSPSPIMNTLIFYTVLLWNYYGTCLVIFHTVWRFNELKTFSTYNKCISQSTILAVWHDI